MAILIAERPTSGFLKALFVKLLNFSKKIVRNSQQELMEYESFRN